MAYGAALEMRYGATHRGFKSRPLRQPLPRPGQAALPARPLVVAFLLSAGAPTAPAIIAGPC